MLQGAVCTISPWRGNASNIVDLATNSVEHFCFPEN